MVPFVWSQLLFDCSTRRSGRSSRFSRRSNETSGKCLNDLRNIPKRQMKHALHTRHKNNRTSVFKLTFVWCLWIKINKWPMVWNYKTVVLVRNLKKTNVFFITTYFVKGELNQKLQNIVFTIKINVLIIPLKLIYLFNILVFDY